MERDLARDGRPAGIDPQIIVAPVKAKMVGEYLQRLPRRCAKQALRHLVTAHPVPGEQDEKRLAPPRPVRPRRGPAVLHGAGTSDR